VGLVPRDECRRELELEGGVRTPVCREGSCKLSFVKISAGGIGPYYVLTVSCM
jgi:hypothetical protein